MTSPLRYALGSLVVGLLVLGIKTASWYVSGSAALYSDALESIVNVFAALMLIVALHTAAKPADVEHPYGHAKAELFSAVAEGTMIVLAAALILERAAQSVGHPLLPVRPVLGLTLNASSGIANLAWAAILTRSGATKQFPALEADRAHLVADAITTVGIIGGLIIAIAANIPILDPLIAIAIAIQIAVIGGRTILNALSLLLDRAPPPEIVARIRALVATHATGALEAHDMRMRQAGRSSFLEFHLVVPGTMTVAESHLICDRIETALKQEMPGAIITIHVEPDHKAKHQGVLVV